MNCLISADLRRGSLIVFPKNRTVPNVSSALNDTDIDYLRDVLGHGVIEDAGEPIPGIVSEQELKRRYDFLRDRVAAAHASGDMRTVCLYDEEMRIAGSAYNDVVARRNMVAVPAPAGLNQW